MGSEEALGSWRGERDRSGSRRGKEEEKGGGLGLLRRAEGLV
jgi:hypothetical protein